MVLTKEGRKLCVWLPESMYLRLKDESLRARQPSSEIVAEAIQAHLEKLEASQEDRRCRA